MSDENLLKREEAEELLAMEHTPEFIRRALRTVLSLMDEREDNRFTWPRVSRLEKEVSALREREKELVEALELLIKDWKAEGKAIYGTAGIEGRCKMRCADQLESALARCQKEGEGKNG